MAQAAQAKRLHMRSSNCYWFALTLIFASIRTGKFVNHAQTQEQDVRKKKKILLRQCLRHLSSLLFPLHLRLR